MARWHEIEDTYRQQVIDVLKEEAEAWLVVMSVMPCAPLVAEAFETAIAVLEAVAEKGERIASGEAVRLYGDIRISKK